MPRIEGRAANSFDQLIGDGGAIAVDLFQSAANRLGALQVLEDQPNAQGCRVSLAGAIAQSFLQR